MAAQVIPQDPHDRTVLNRLEAVVRDVPVDEMAAKLADLRLFLDDDLRQVDEAIRLIDRRDTPLHKSAGHLLDLGGKRLRPTCVALASRVGRGFGPEAREVAVAVELIHSATLLHDDVVDNGDLRRGAPTARVLYGNAASIFAGDWLLVDALQRVAKVGLAGQLDHMLAVLKEMLDAEALQLQNRGSLRGSVEDYFRVVEGKTASLFRWGLRSGGQAGGATPAQCEALERFGGALGVAFQVVDDVLDVAGDGAQIGKSLFADLREGKATYPLLVAVQRDARLGEQIEAALRENAIESIEGEVSRRIRATGAVEASRELAAKLSGEALDSLKTLPASPVRDALEQVAVAMLHRRK
jgi:octaprenyl-diphosphate synthase